MSEPVSVYWSFRSPYSYLVTPDLLKLQQDFNIDLRLCVVLPIAIRNKAAVFDRNNRKPAMYIMMDSARRAQFLDLPYAWPNPDPIVQNYETMEVASEQPHIYRLSKLGVEAQRRGRGIEFAASVSRLIFGGTANWNEGSLLADAAAEAGLDLADMEGEIAASDGDDAQSGLHMEQINKHHAELEAAGHWGVPTMVVRNEPFFGQDRVETLRWRLDQLGLKK